MSLKKIFKLYLPRVSLKCTSSMIHGMNIKHILRNIIVKLVDVIQKKIELKMPKSIINCYKLLQIYQIKKYCYCHLSLSIRLLIFSLGNIGRMIPLIAKNLANVIISSFFIRRAISVKVCFSSVSNKTVTITMT